MLEVGKKYRVRTELVDGVQYGEDYFMSSGMAKFKGTEVTISRKLSFGGYEIVEDDGGWGWSEEMFDVGLIKEFYAYTDGTKVRRIRGQGLRAGWKKVLIKMYEVEE